MSGEANGEAKSFYKLERQFSEVRTDLTSAVDRLAVATDKVSTEIHKLPEQIRTEVALAFEEGKNVIPLKVFWAIIGVLCAVWFGKEVTSFIHDNRNPIMEKVGAP